MLLKNDQIRHIQSVAHQGKVVVVATCNDGTLTYSIRQDGFEVNAVNTPPDQRTGWETWTVLPLPDDTAGDRSVTDLEAAKLTVPSSDPKAPAGATEHVLRSIYRSKGLTAVAPVQLVSGGDHLYVFRQSTTGTLLVDRFVLDGMANELVPKIEVRYRRSRQRHKPAAAGKKSAQNMDTLDFTDIAGQYFYEPTTEIACVKNLQNGWFSVVQVPTNEHEKLRWHVFSCQGGKIEVASLRTSEEGLIDVKDHTVFDPDPTGGSELVPRIVPGILRRTLTLDGAEAIGGPAATVYDIQEEVRNAQTGESHLLRTDSRVMLVVPTRGGMTALSFAIAGDGTLSRIDTAADSAQVLRADQVALLLPLSTMDGITAFGAAAAPPSGTISGMARGSEASDAEGRVVVTSPQASLLSTGESIKVAGTTHYDGLYQVSQVSGDTFQIQAAFAGASLGTWEKEAPKPSLVFDGMVKSYEVVAGGLKIQAVNHGLADGELVQIVGTASYDGTYPVSKLDATHFVLACPWTQPAAHSAKILSTKRRGVVLDGTLDYIELPLESLPGGDQITVSFWAKGDCVLGARSATTPDLFRAEVSWTSSNVCFKCGADSMTDAVQRPPVTADERASWIHWAFTKDVALGEMKIFRNGELWNAWTGKVSPILAANVKVTAVTLARYSPTATGVLARAGTTADLCIYSRTLTAAEIKNGMYLPPSDGTPDLEGYWPLGAIVEETPRLVLDFSIHGRDGTVRRAGGGASGAYVSAISRGRNLEDQTPAVKYANDEVLPVAAGATYQEELEVRLDGGVVNPGNVDGNGGRAFAFSYWGKANRNTDARIALTASLPTTFVDLNSDGWHRASSAVIIPRGVSYLRSFEVSAVSGTWQKIEIRRHRVILVSDAITQVRGAETVSAAPAFGALTVQGRFKALQQSFGTFLALEHQEGALVQEIQELRRALGKPGLSTTAQAEINATITAYTTRLTAVRAQITSFHTNDLRRDVTTVNDPTTAASWPMPVIATEQRNGASLTTQRATLDCVRPGSALSAIQTCEGNVQVSYVDEDGRMRQVMYDATAEAMDAGAFDRWWPRPPGGSLQLAADTAAVTLSPPLELGPEWTMEAWFYFPLPQSTQPGWSTLATTTDATSGLIVVRDGRYLGVRIAGRFVSAGYSLGDLCPGWHHVAAVKRGAAGNATIAFYLDGEPVGDTMTSAGAMLKLDGKSDAVSLAPQSFPSGSAMTFCVWTLDPAGPFNGHLLRVTDPAASKVVYVQVEHTDTAGRVVFGCGADTVVYDFTRPTTAEAWTHWAFTKNTLIGTMSIYRNGVLAVQGQNKRAALPPPAPASGGTPNTVALGPAYPGSIIEPSLWNKELVAEEVALAVGRIPTSTDVGLCGSWYFDGKVVKDRMQPPKDGTIAGAPLARPVSFDTVTEIGSIGNLPSGTRTVTSTVTPSVLVLNGTSSFVEIPPTAWPGSPEITVCFWAKGGTPSANGVVFISGPTERIMSCHVPWSDGVVYFDTGLGTGSFDRLSASVGANPYQGKWTHWAFTKNCGTGEMKMYCNGAVFAASGGNTRAMPAASRIVFGAMDSLGTKVSFYTGWIRDVNIWIRALPQAEIQKYKDAPPLGLEPGLWAAYRFDAAKAVDLTPRHNDGRYLGGATTTLDPTVAYTITSTVTSAGSQQFGKVAEVRFWSNALTPAEVAVNSKTILTGAEPGLLAYYPLRAPVTTSVGNRAVPDPSEPLVDQPPPVATVTDGAFSAGSPPIGNPGNAVMWFDGIDDHVALPEATLDFAKGITLEAWILFEGLARPAKIVDLGNGPGVDNIALSSVPATRSLLLQVYRGTAVQSLQVDGVLELGRWMHAAVTIAVGGAATIYKDGMAVKTGTVHLPATVKRTRSFLGKSNWAADGYFDGQLAEVRLWNVARTSLEVQAYAYRRVSGKETGLAGYWPLDEVTPGAPVTGITVKGPAATLHDTTFSPLPSPIGDPGQNAVVFDGRTSHVSLEPMEVGLSGGFTIEAWVRYNDFQNCSRILELGNGPSSDNVLFYNNTTSNNLILLVFRTVPTFGPMSTQVEAPGVLELGRWTHVAATVDMSITGRPNATLYKDGQVVATDLMWSPANVRRTRNYLGKATWDNNPNFAGHMTEVRLWTVARSQADIQNSMYSRLTGAEPGLAGYWPLYGGGTLVTPDRGPNRLEGTVTPGVLAVRTNALPVGFDAVTSAEYSTTGTDPNDSTNSAKMAIMRRFFGGAVGGGALLFPHKRIEAAVLTWVGNGQFEPTLLGFIEGAPPVPSENLTESLDYNGATSVELSVSKDLSYSWSRSQSAALGGNLEAFVGVDSNTEAGVFGCEIQKVASVRAGLKGSASYMHEKSSSSTVSSHSSSVMTDRLDLRGMLEEEAKFPHLGRRFVPKNVGYALVISSVADVFVTRLAKSGKMVGYVMLPVEGIPPDVNTLTFMMNPAYTMQGSLDGMTGTRATSDRFHRNVPEMRTQYGALYPASYYRLKDAYALKEKLEGADKERAAFFAQYKITDPSDAMGGTQDTGSGPAAWLAKIGQLVSDVGEQVAATSAFQDWQRRMENLLAKSGKRNIVNTYVWDANGGLHADQQSFAGTVEHTIGGSFNMDASVGLQRDTNTLGFALEITALANFNLTQSISKTESSSTGVELRVGLDGVEHTNITDFRGKPVLPGEKVSRYRFMTFYLEASTDHFNDFFREVVDPEWLMGNSEEARALRQARGKANKTWRVFHRVTYVERPALAAVGSGVRVGPSREEDSADVMTRYLQSLTDNQLSLQAQLNDVMKVLQALRLKLGS